MLTEESHITIERLLERWPGMTHDVIGGMIADLFGGEKGVTGDIFVLPFPQPFVRRGVERFNPNTGKIVWDVSPLAGAPYYHYDHQSHDLDRICFKTAEIERYEESHPEVFYQVVDANDLPAPPSPGQAAANEYIEVEEAARQLKMSPVSFARYLINRRNELPLTGLTTSDRDFFYGQWGNASIEETADMLESHNILIHRLDWENHLKTMGGPGKKEASSAGGKAEARPGLAEAVRGYEAELNTAKEKIASLEAELAREREAHAKTKEAVQKKAGLEGQLGKAKKDLERWQAALTWMIPAAVAVGQEGPKPRVRAELKSFTQAAEGPEGGVYFEAWRDALPDSYCDKKDKSDRETHPPVTDEPVDV